MPIKRVHVFYSGNVQGVGFRYTAQDIALGLGITGWVKNLRDNRVEIVSEGEEAKLNSFLEEILKSPLGRYIRDIDVSWEKPAHEFEGFDITF